MKALFLFFVLVVPVTLIVASSVIILFQIGLSKIKKLWSL